MKSVPLRLIPTPVPPWKERITNSDPGVSKYGKPTELNVAKLSRLPVGLISNVPPGPDQMVCIPNCD